MGVSLIKTLRSGFLYKHVCQSTRQYTKFYSCLGERQEVGSSNATAYGAL